nr:Ataxin-3 [Polyrhizophydium stewartii]
MDIVPSIVFERQEGQLCAQHSLNALLQGNYFTAVDLSHLAQELDEAEAQDCSAGRRAVDKALAEGSGGLESEALRKLREGGSANYDDSGFFSVQVITKALSVHQQAFICNLDQHWFTLRRFGASPERWYNLNSLLPEPKYVSETFLGMLISQLESEGYSIYAVIGALPQCEADVLALQRPKPPADALPKSGKPAQHGPFAGAGRSLTEGRPSRPEPEWLTEDEMLARAVALSMGADPGPSSGQAGPVASGTSDDDLSKAIAASIAEMDSRDVTLQRTLASSMLDSSAVPYAPSTSSASGSSSAPPKPAAPAQPELSEIEHMRRKRLERFGSLKDTAKQI